ncbi:MAG: alpha/beta hydrolase [Candidatus Korarchaeota archaeon]
MDVTTFDGYDRTKLHKASWKVNNARGAIIIVHGFAEHIGRYDHVAKFLNELGFNVYGYDQRGHGKSEGDRGYVKNFDEYIMDLNLFVNCVLKEENGHPLFLLGHSMGGLIVLRYGILHRDAPVKGIIASAPALRLGAKTGKVKYALGKFLAKVAGHSKMDAGIDASLLTHDKNVVEQYINDPLVFKKISARLGIELIKKGNDTLKRASEFTFPCLLMIGSDDRLVAPEGVKEFYEKCGSKDKSLKIYEKFYHEILNEIEKEKAFNDIKTWLQKEM